MRYSFLAPTLQFVPKFNLHVPSGPDKEVVVLIAAHPHVRIDVISGH